MKLEMALSRVWVAGQNKPGQVPVCFVLCEDWLTAVQTLQNLYQLDMAELEDDIRPSTVRDLEWEILENQPFEWWTRRTGWNYFLIRLAEAPARFPLLEISNVLAKKT